MKQRSVIILLILLVAAIGLPVLSYFGIGSQHIMGVQNIKQGLDLKGGVSIVYQADAENPSAVDMNAAKALLQGRLDNNGWTEAEVAIQGTNRLTVDIPSVTDVEEAISTIGETAQLMFMDETGAVLLTGADVESAAKASVSANPNTGQASEIIVDLRFTPEGTKKFADATANNIGKPLMILMDGVPISSPIVNAAIPDGNAQITGSFTSQEAQDLADKINAGSLPFNLDIISTNNVGARLGSESLLSSIEAGLIGFAAVFIFMIIIYRTSGFAADWALVIYAGLMLVILSLFGITLTLPGIAGFILSVGMAVDANVIIFERLKEEISGGRTLRSAEDQAFKRAFPAILDSHVTTFIAALILFMLGSGPIKGFAQTLMLGTVLSLFTAMTVTQLIIRSLVGVGITNPKWYIGFKRAEEAGKGGDAK